MIRRTWLPPLFGLVVALGTTACGSVAPEAEARTLEVFADVIVHFTPDTPDKFVTATVGHSDNGREIRTVLELPPRDAQQRIVARVATRPIPKDVQNVHDKWDRAGHVRLVRDGEPDVEVVKFVTAYGGVTEHEVDVTHLAPLLAGRCEFVGFVDTWSSPGWEMDFSLTFRDDPGAGAPDWAAGAFFDQRMNAEEQPEGGYSVDVEIPAGITRVELRYLVSGHCTDGVDADEFQTKDNVLDVDGVEAFRVRPWRDDCGRFRAVNPYCRRWSNGTWSSDYSRSGWCPSDVVAPLEADLTDQLPAGRHTLRFRVENMRPKDDAGNFGYWRVSAHLVGWRE